MRAFMRLEIAMDELIENLSGERMQFAVLIDADNISSKYAGTIFEELEKYGLSTYRRIYGNWSKGNSSFLIPAGKMPQIWRW